MIIIVDYESTSIIGTEDHSRIIKFTLEDNKHYRSVSLRSHLGNISLVSHSKSYLNIKYYCCIDCMTGV